MKKICWALFLVALTFFNFAEARNHYVGIYPSSGLKAYLMTETIKIGIIGTDFRCTVVCYPSQNKPYYVDYRFWSDYRGVYFVNSDGYVQQVDEYKTPVEANVVKYVVLYY